MKWKEKGKALLVGRLRLNRRVLVGLFLGQVLSLLVTGTGITSQLLAARHRVNLPITQSSLNYLLLLLLYLPCLIYLRHFSSSSAACSSRREKTKVKKQEVEEPERLLYWSDERRLGAESDEEEGGEEDVVVKREGGEEEECGEEEDMVRILPAAPAVAAATTPLKAQLGQNIPQSVTKVLKEKWWFYLLISIADVEANFLVVKAYQYTTITSVMLLDCFSIPCVMLLTFVLLRTRYRPLHYVGVLLCLAGLAGLVVADANYNREHGGGSKPLLGDILCLCGALLYSLSNVGQEASVKRFDRVEFLAMIGLFGFPINFMQASLLEYQEWKSTTWNTPVVLLMLGFAACLFLLYSLTPFVLQMSGSTMFNLSLLTSDGFAIIAGIFLFDHVVMFFSFPFSFLSFLSFETLSPSSFFLLHLLSLKWYFCINIFSFICPTTSAMALHYCLLVIFSLLCFIFWH
ncbi:Solute carrier family 35 member F1-like [Balamuthia mandrillaris]